MKETVNRQIKKKAQAIIDEGKEKGQDLVS